TASAFDHVFTTEIDCIGKYKAALGHDRVYLFPFACQPAIYNPITDATARREAFVFAGSYSRRYPERTRDFDGLLETLPAFREIDIYDRNFGSEDENYAFPDKYLDRIVGTLAPERVADTYRRYSYAINLNSVKQSQTMFARRVLELLASNT